MMKRYLLYFFACFVMSIGALACGDNGGGGDGDNNGGPACTTNEDCGADQQCYNDICVGASGASCNVDLDCPNEWEYCGGGTCLLAGCTEDAQCAGDAICENNRCGEGCRGDEDCSDGMFCNPTSNQCEPPVECTPGSCQSHMVCDQSLDPAECVPDGSCSTELHCTRYERFVEDGIDYICDGSSCIEKPPCESDDQCEPGEICVEGECGAGCRSDEECLLGEYCDEDTLKCIQGCNSDADCSDGEICVDEGDGEPTCEVECFDRDDCAEGMICQDSYCQYCTDDNQCYGLEFCDAEAETSPEGDEGLCAPLPPECPLDEFDEDPYGGNHTQADAVEITQFPFERVDDDTTEEDERPVWCDEHTAHEWFKLTAAPGKVIEVVVEYDNTSGGNLDVALVDTNGDDIIASAQSPTEDNGTERIVFGVNPTRTNPLEAFIQVRGLSVEAKMYYSINVDVRDPAPCTDDAYEENDVHGDAPYLGTQGDMSGSENDVPVCGDDVDWYLIDVPPNHILEVTIEAPVRLGDVDLQVSDPSAHDVGIGVHEETGDSEKVTLRTADGGTFLVNVFLQENAGNALYDIGYNIVPDECDDLAEINNTCGEAFPVADASSLDDLNICQDNDYYKVMLNPLDTLTVTATYDPAQSAGEMQMTLFGRDRSSPDADTCQNFLLSADEVPVSGTGEIQLVIDEYQAELGGEFYILASRFSGIRVNYDFDITVEPGPPCDDDLFDENGGNDDSSSAVALQSSEVIGNGPDAALVGQQICDANEDWFELTIADGETLTWEIVHDDTQGEVDAALIDSDGSTPVTDDSGNAITLDGSGQLSVTNDSGGDKTYYLRVAGKDGIPVRNSYWLLSYIDGDGPIDTICPDVYEDNDVSNEAAEIAEGEHTNLLVCSTDDGGGDWYRTFVEAGQTLTVSATFDNPNGNAWLRLYQQSDLNNDVVQATATGDTYTASYTSARDQYIYYRLDTSPGVVGDVYSLNVDLTAAPSCQDDRFAGNSAAASAEVVDAPGLFMNLMHCDDAADWFAVELTEDQLFEAYVNYDNSLADLDVEIYQASDLTTPVQSGDISAQFTPPSDGDDTQTYTATYYVRVASADPSVSVRLPYDLLLYRDLDGDGTFSADEGPEDRLCPDAFENNDTSAQAASIPAGSYSDLRLCAGNPTDDDYYSVYLPAGATLTVDVTFDPANNVDLYLKNEGGTQVDSSQQAVGASTETVTVTNNSSLGAEYTVHVDGGTATYQTYYTMDVTLQFSTDCAEDAFGEITSMATAAAPGAGAYELALCEGTEDWFEVTLADGEEIEAHVELRNRLGDIDVELVDASGNQKAVAATDENVEDLFYTNTTGATETLYLRVYPKDGAFMRNDYDLWMRLGANHPQGVSFCPDDYERNDTTETAPVLDISSDSQFSDMIACGAEEDWYAVQLQSGTTYDIDVFFDHSVDFDLDIALLDANGNVVQDTSSTDIDFGTHSSDNDEQVTFTAPSTGTYFFGVKNHGTAADTYRVQFTSENAACPEDAFEFNDNAGLATPLPQNLPVDLAVGACGDEDFYSWVAPADGTVTVTLYLENSETNLGLSVQETDPNAQPPLPQLVGYDQGAPTYPIDDNRVSATFAVTEGFSYTIQVSRLAVQGQSQPSNGAYFLSLE